MELFILLLIGVAGWLMYMATCRTDDLIRLMKADAEYRKTHYEQMGKAAGGVAKAGLFAIKLFKR